MDNQNPSSADNAIKAAHAGSMIKNIASGAVSGGIPGMILAGMGKSPNIIPMLLGGISFLIMLPILFILMLPSLIFGSNGIDNVSKDVLNNHLAITANIAEVESAVESMLIEKHQTLLSNIHTAAKQAGYENYSITDDFSDSIIYESTLLISQFCASQENYQNINLARLKGMLNASDEKIFSYRVSAERVTEAGNTSTHYIYTVQYKGSTYFAKQVFNLTEKQISLANDYAKNLHMFLYDTVFETSANPEIDMPIDPNTNLPMSKTGNAVVDMALTKLGYIYSQPKRNLPGYFDCSSFTFWVYKQFGISLMHGGANTAAAQGRLLTEKKLIVSYKNLTAGDLVFYSFEVNNRFMNIGHVGIYAGNGKIVDASSSKGMVVYRNIYDIDNIVLCGRPLALLKK